MANPKERSAVRVLLPYVGMMKSQARWIALGWLVSLITAIASIGLLALSGWFLTATALAGVTLATAKSFNYYTPGAGVRGFAIARTAGRYAERIVTHEATFRLLADLRVALYKAIEPLSLNQLSRFRSSDLLTRFVADIDALDNLYLRVMIPTLNAWVLSAAVVAVVSVWQPFAGVGLAVLLLLATVVIPLLFARLASKVSAQLVEDRKAFRDLWGEHIAALPEWISFNRMDDQKARLATQEAKLAQTQLKMVAISCVGQTLLDMGYLKKVARNAYELGPQVVSRGFAFLAGKDLIDIAAPHINALRDETSISCHLGIRDGLETIYVYRAQASQRLSVNIPLGTRLPCHTNAMGRVLLQQLSEIELNAMYQTLQLDMFPGPHPQSFPELKTLLKREWQQGYSSNRSDNATAIAYPIKNYMGRTIAAINISGADQIMNNPEQFEGAKARLLEAANAISKVAPG